MVNNTGTTHLPSSVRSFQFPGLALSLSSSVPLSPTFSPLGLIRIPRHADLTFPPVCVPLLATPSHQQSPLYFSLSLSPSLLLSFHRRCDLVHRRPRLHGVHGACRESVRRSRFERRPACVVPSYFRDERSGGRGKKKKKKKGKKRGEERKEKKEGERERERAYRARYGCINLKSRVARV